jgi:hypothetical protein
MNRGIERAVSDMDGSGVSKLGKERKVGWANASRWGIKVNNTKAVNSHYSGDRAFIQQVLSTGRWKVMEGRQ